MMEERVTILIPTYNRGTLIENTIKNCFLQSSNDFRILIYDDASTDNTEQIVKNISMQYPNKITYIKGTKNLGIGHARNILLRNLNTEMGMWLDSDDLMDSSRISLCLSYLDENPDIDVVYSNIQWFTEEGNVIKLRNHITINTAKYDKNSWASLKSNTACATGFFRSTLNKFNFEESLRLGGEDVLWIWLLLQHNINIGHINKSLYLYRNHRNRIGRDKRDKSLVKLKEIEDHILAQKIKDIKNDKC